MRTRIAACVAAMTVAALAVAGCSGGNKQPASSAGTPSGDPTSISGPITVLTQRTDLQQDGTLKRYAAAFNKTYPNVAVTFQAITDYEGEVKTRMNTSNYGDVLMIPPSIAKSDYVKFFAPLGDAKTMGQKYQWITAGTTDGTDNGQVYGVATFGNANGFVYNKSVWKKAGITSDPTTVDAFLADLKKIKASTSAVPYYTNYHDGWPAQGWSGVLGSPSCNADANTELASDEAPFSPGKDPYVAYNTLFSIAHDKLIESDPTTTNWEGSKSMLATGKVATMWLGSWAMVQMRDAAKKAGTNPDDIGFMPFPTQKDGKFCVVTGPDYLAAVNIHSEHQQAARAWLDFFVDSSGYAADSGSIPTKTGSALPSISFADYNKLPITYVTMNQKNSATVSQIDNESEVGFFSSPNSAQKVIDVARGAASGSLAAICADLNKKWADGISTVGG